MASLRIQFLSNSTRTKVLKLITFPALRQHSSVSASVSPLYPKLSQRENGENVHQRRGIHLTKRTEEIITTNPENAVWDPVREFNFRRFAMFDSLGWDLDDQEVDEFLARYMMFWGFSIMAVGTFFYYRYRPIYTGLLHDWAKREAYRLVEEREAAGLPVIDINYAPVEEIEPFLPPDFNMYTCDVETDFTWYNQTYQSVPAPIPIDFFAQRPKILGAMHESQRVLSDGSKYVASQ